MTLPHALPTVRPDRPPRGNALVIAVKNGLLLTGDELTHAVNAAHLQNAVANRRFQQDGQVTAGGHLKNDLADRNTEDFIRQVVERQARERIALDMLLQMHDQAKFHFAP